MTAAITDVRGRRVWDSRGRPTIEAEVRCGGAIGRAIAPVGASTGSGEAVALLDGGRGLGGRDVRRAVDHVNGVIASTLVGLEVGDQRAVDHALVGLDASPSLSSIGANAVVATSMACAHAAAAVSGQPLWQLLLGDTADTVKMPLPEIQIFGGGAHAGRRIDIQDLMVMAPGASNVAEALEWTAEIYAAAGELVGGHGVADEGGWWPAFDTNEQAIETLVNAIERTGLAPGSEVVISLDVAASELLHDGTYCLTLDNRRVDRDEMVDLVRRWCADYPIASIEDPVGEDDIEGWRDITRLLQGHVQVVGDDVFVTDETRVRSLDGVASAVLVKVNQAGTLTRASDALAAARDTGRGAIVSARSGESEDVTIVHLAVGWQVQQLKVGSIARGERTAKWNEALRIEEDLGGRARFAGRGPLPGGLA